VDTSSPSVALIRVLREITRLGKALDKVTTLTRDRKKHGLVVKEILLFAPIFYCDTHRYIYLMFNKW